MNILAELRQRFSGALRQLFDDDGADSLSALVLPSQDAKFGDYQANCAMPLGKQVGKPPREIAAELVACVDLSDLCEPPEVAGPGFINLKLRNDWLASTLKGAIADLERTGVPRVAKKRTFVLDFSSPNIAKPMHVGHIRSTVIGDSLGRTLRFLGHEVISDNHIGDWGTQFGMIIYGYKHFVDEAALAAAPVAELSRLYKQVNQLVEYHATLNDAIPAAEAKIAEQRNRIEQLQATAPPRDPKAAKKAEKKVRQASAQLGELQEQLRALREKVSALDADAALKELAIEHSDIGAAVLAETAALHAGDPVNRGLWERFLPACKEEIDATYDRLGVQFDHTLGESYYDKELPRVAQDLVERGLARESDGALCVFIEGIDAPFIVRKRDGAFLYATTDLATIQFRMRQWRPDAILYVVDHRQSLHFKQLFAAARLWGYDEVELQHVSFGTVLGEDGRPYKTRTGAAVGLTGLLDEAVQRAHAIAAESAVLESEQERMEVAERIGIGAIKYADLSHNRTSDYQFSYDKMLAMNGNTAAYMQYSYARVRGIFSRGEVDVAALRKRNVEVCLDNPAERALAVALLQFSEALSRVVEDYRPNCLTDYLFELAGRFATFFQQCPVLKAETDQLRDSRLLLCDLTARTLATGLKLLGIKTVDRM